MTNTETAMTRRGGFWRDLASRDFLPGASTHVRAFARHPLGILTLAGVASTLCGLFLHPQGFVLAGGVFAVVSLGLFWPWVSLAGVAACLAFDRARCTEGDEAEARLTLTNALPWPALGLAVRGGFGGAASEALMGISFAPRRRSAACRRSFVPPRRGVYPLSSPRLTTAFPFGLRDSSRPIRVDERLIVHPRAYPVGPVPTVSGDRQAEGAVSRDRVGSHGDIVGVRPYRRGDSPRRIHWPQSARHDKLIVCETQSSSRPVVQIVVDVDPSAHDGDSREWAIRVAASFAKGWLADGAVVGLVAGESVVPPSAGAAQVNRILDALAAIPDDTCPPLPDTLAAPACRAFRDGIQLVVASDRTARPASNGTDRRFATLVAGGSPTPGDWLTFPDLASIPALLRGGWKEAKHGS